MRRTYLDKWICDTEVLPALTREGLACLQLERLNRALERMHDLGRLPEDLPRQLKCLTELQTLPFTTPEMLAASPGRWLLTSQSEVERVISGATSGTTGPAKRVFYTASDMEHTVGFFAAGISEMLSAGERCLIAFPFTGPDGLGDLIARAVERLGAEPVRGGFGQSWRELCALLDAATPDTYIGFPVPLLGLARMYGQPLPIRRALVSGDACPAGVMAELEALLGSRLFPHYGSRECGLGGAVTCPAFEGMHLRENHIIAEIVDAAGNPLPDGAWGELVITTIGLEAMPLIRYRTGDMTRILPPCPCGGVTRRLDRVSRKEPGPVSMEDLDSTLFPLPGLIDYRAEWDGCLHIEARVLDNGLEKAIRTAACSRYPDIDVSVTAAPCQQSDRPMYLGKRYVRGNHALRR